MTIDEKLTAIRDVIQLDIGNRGLKKDPAGNLISATLDDFANACRSLAAPEQLRVGIVTGFLIPTADPPRAETDGPLGALYLARAMHSMGMNVALASDDFCVAALRAGLDDCQLADAISLLMLPRTNYVDYVDRFEAKTGLLTHLIAIERVGPAHNGRCHTMRGRDITDQMAPAHRLFEKEPIRAAAITIGIGDGGNEIGMGKIPVETIERNISNGALIACRVPTDHLIVTGISNWGAYALAAGVALLRGQILEPSLFDPERERQLLQLMVERGPLVDGITAQPTATVDGVAFEEYIRPLLQIRKITEERT